jgi:hypothetical protein
VKRSNAVRAQTAHISLHLPNFQRAKTQNNQPAETLGASAALPLEFLLWSAPPLSVPPFLRFRVTVASVRRCLRPGPGGRKRKNEAVCENLRITALALWKTQ